MDGDCLSVPMSQSPAQPTHETPLQKKPKTEILYSPYPCTFKLYCCDIVGGGGSL